MLVPKDSTIKSFDDLKGKKIATGRGSIGHQLILAALEQRGWTASDVQIVFLAPSDAKVAYTQRLSRCVVDLGALCEPGRGAVPVAPSCSMPRA